MLIERLAYRRPLSEGERLGVFMHGNVPDVLYPAVHELYSLGEPSETALSRFIVCRCGSATKSLKTRCLAFATKRSERSSSRPNATQISASQHVASLQNITTSLLRCVVSKCSISYPIKTTSGYYLSGKIQLHPQGMPDFVGAWSGGCVAWASLG